MTVIPVLAKLPSNAVLTGMPCGLQVANILLYSSQLCVQIRPVLPVILNGTKHIPCCLP